ncbi:MAG TPA: hypothetical protein DDW33_01950 [Ktedonobacter sp.]|jgi:hypothetical protein|nr:hypothetical protein [Ktedonobacter sp.]HAG98119.1 hypothetical protein [Ktedonobacter sp.]HAT47221.1 hypothetical protein [Ktedonobacter sp.]HBE24436.1 hypothetical protein [Ktedonobacter sp.]HCF87717.1 hypothetical protein [Ktedonobacter sp.]
MEPSDQQPAEEMQKQDTSRDTSEEQLAFQPLYEFPPDGLLSGVTPQPAPLTRVLPTKELESATLDEEAIRQGHVYPPPPSYYQNMPLQSVQPPLPLPTPTSMAPDMYTPPVHSHAQPGNTQTYPPPGAYPYPSQPPAKKSYRWVWILVSIVSVFVLAGCGFCGWAFYNVFNTTYHQVAGSVNVVDDFYTNLQAKNYMGAYSDLAPQGQINGLTQAAFTTQAKQLDEKDGPVVSFILSQPTLRTDPNTGPDLSHFTMTVAVKRTHSSYDVLLSLANIHGTWKITDYDRL